MIVKCLKIYNIGLDKIVDKKRNSFITVGNLYQVLEVYFRKKEINFRIIPDDASKIGIEHPILVRANEFEVVSGKIPPNWVMYRGGEEFFKLSPEKWTKFEEWQESFWEDFGNSIPEALRCYEQELKVIQEFEPL